MNADSKVLKAMSGLLGSFAVSVALTTGVPSTATAGHSDALLLCSGNGMVSSSIVSYHSSHTSHSAHSSHSSSRF